MSSFDPCSGLGVSEDKEVLIPYCSEYPRADVIWLEFIGLHLTHFELSSVRHLVIGAAEALRSALR